MIITLTGMPGAGKSTIANMLAETLSISRFSAGDFRRKMAEERGMTLEEFNTLGETEAFTDKETDAYQEKLGKEQDHFVIDGRLSWHFIPHSFKIFLDVDVNEATRRVYGDIAQGQRKNEAMVESLEEVKTSLVKRLASDQKRYQQYYGIDYLDPNNYDLVIDTTDKDPKKILQLILKSLDEKA